MKTHNYLVDSNQIFCEKRTKDEERVVGKIMEGNIKYCLELLMKAMMKKRKNTAMIFGVAGGGDDEESEDEVGDSNDSNENPFNNSIRKKKK